jgi:hypothetical protein
VITLERICYPRLSVVIKGVQKNWLHGRKATQRLGSAQAESVSGEACGAGSARGEAVTPDFVDTVAGVHWLDASDLGGLDGRDLLAEDFPRDIGPEFFAANDIATERSLALDGRAVI